jgi:tetratricopeptide (TPR) repeat protein
MTSELAAAESAAGVEPATEPSIAEAFARFQEGRLADAETICNAILTARPEDFDSLHLLGLLRHRQGRNAEALRLVAAVLRRAPRSAEVLSNYGLILTALKRHEEALACFEDALASDAGYLLALKNRAASLKSLGRHDEALAAFAAVHAARPDDIDVLNECGGLLVRLGQIEAALACYDRALALAPQVVELQIKLRVNKGTAFAAACRFTDALACFDAAIAIDPQCADAHHRASLIRLRSGDFKNGWRDFEWRWRTQWSPQVRRVDAPLWRGEPIEGKTILLLAEQGYGDTIQFIRYVPMVAALGAKVILDVPPPLQEIALGIDGAAAVLRTDALTPRVDYQCPLMSLPLAFATDLATVPASVPYIHPSPELVAEWRDRLPQTGRPRVGLCWAGSGAHLNDHNRSIALSRFVEILSLPDLHFISVQREVDAEARAILLCHGVVALGQDFESFSDTAAVLAELDLLISVDTAVAHLAGAIGKPVALLLPYPAEWRWLTDRADSPWYPSMRLFRQTAAGDWDAPLVRLHKELGLLAQR